MTAGYLHRYDGGENIWRRDYHRSDTFYTGATFVAGTSVIFNNTFAFDFLVTSAWITVFNGSPAAIYGQLHMTNAADVWVYDLLGLYVAISGCDAIAMSFPTPIEVKTLYKVKVKLNAVGAIQGGIAGVQEQF